MTKKKKDQDIVFIDTSSAEMSVILKFIFGEIPNKEFPSLNHDQYLNESIDHANDQSMLYWSRLPLNDASKLDELLNAVAKNPLILSTSKKDLSEILKLNQNFVDQIITKPFNPQSVKNAFTKGLTSSIERMALLELRSDLTKLTEEENLFLAENRIHKTPPKLKENPMFFEICADFYASLDLAHKAVPLYQQGLRLKRYHRGCLAGYIKALYDFKLWKQAIHLSKILISSCIVDAKTIQLIIRVSLVEEDIKLYKLIDQYIQKYFSDHQETLTHFAYATFVQLKNKLDVFSDQEFQKYIPRIKYASEEYPNLYLAIAEFLYSNQNIMRLDIVLKALNHDSTAEQQFKCVSFFQLMLRPNPSEKIINSAKELVEIGYNSKIFLKSIKNFMIDNPNANGVEELKQVIQEVD